MKTWSWDELNGEITENEHDEAQRDADEGWTECGKILTNGRHWSIDLEAESPEDARNNMAHLANTILASVEPEKEETLTDLAWAFWQQAPHPSGHDIQKLFTALVLRDEETLRILCAEYEVTTGE